MLGLELIFLQKICYVDPRRPMRYTIPRVWVVSLTHSSQAIWSRKNLIETQLKYFVTQYIRNIPAETLFSAYKPQFHRAPVGAI